MRSMAQAQLKRTRAVELLGEGLNYEEIAQAVGYTNRGSAHRAVSKALAEREIESVDKLRAVELDRLDALHKAHWQAALAGDIAATQILLKISAERRRWYGVERPSRGTTSPLYGGAVLVQPELEGNAGEATPAASSRHA